MLHAASKFTTDKQVLKQIYFSRIRCKLDQSAVVWNGSLTLKNKSDLERVQKAAIRIICGKNYESYSQTLKELGMVTLSERRENLCLKFAKKSLKINNFGHLFPISTKRHPMKTRGNNYYKISQGFSEQFFKSAIPYMQRLLNEDNRKQLKDLKKFKPNVLSPTNFACF